MQTLTCITIVVPEDCGLAQLPSSLHFLSIRKYKPV